MNKLQLFSEDDLPNKMPREIKVNQTRASTAFKTELARYAETQTSKSRSQRMAVIESGGTVGNVHTFSTVSGGLVLKSSLM